MIGGSICLDLDGTLLDSSKSIGTLSEREIRKKAEQGYTIILASGRHFCEMTEYIDQLHLPKGGYIISCDGLYIHDMSGRMIWESQRIGASDIQKICDIAGVKDVTFFTPTSDVYLISSARKRLRCRIHMVLKCGHLQRKNYIVHDLGDLSDDLRQNIEKAVVNILESDPDRSEQLRESYAVVQYPDGLCEIKRKGTSKLAALIQLQSMKKIDLTDLIYFGDDFNDLECFKCLRRCVAMGNAPDQIRQIASSVTLTNNEDGVGRFLMNL